MRFSIAALRLLTKKPEHHAHQQSYTNYEVQPAVKQEDPRRLERVSSIYDPQMGKTLARKLESQYVFNK